MKMRMGNLKTHSDNNDNNDNDIMQEDMLDINLYKISFSIWKVFRLSLQVSEKSHIFTFSG